MKTQNVVSLPAYAEPTPAASPSAFTVDTAVLFSGIAVITLLGRIEDWRLHWAGRISCTLCLPFGDVPLTANRDTLPLEIQVGSWVRARLLLRHSAPPLLLSATDVKMNRWDPTTAWLPTVPYHRAAHMRRLRVLLSRFEPSLQAIFMVVMANTQVQRRFFWRIAASDHHIYPGGLFDQSVKAAELAYQQTQLSQRARGLAALACLLFDLGKVSDDQFRPDRIRFSVGLAPHPDTDRHIRRALDAVSRFEPDLVESLRTLFDPCDWTEWLSPPGITPTLKQSVHQALQTSWSFDRPDQEPSTQAGATK